MMNNKSTSNTMLALLCFMALVVPVKAEVYIYPIGGVLIIGGIVGCILCCVYGCCGCQKPQQPGAVIFAGGQAPPPANNVIIAGSKQYL